MGNFLAAVGRAQPMNTALKVLDAKHASNQDARRTMLTNSELSEANERIERAKRVNQLEAEQVAEMNKVLPVDSLLDSIEGGAESPMAKMLYDTAVKNGLIDERGGIKKKSLAEMQNIISQPQYAYKLANKRVEYYKGQVEQAKAILADKPNDKNALQAYQENNLKYQAAFEQVPGVKDLLDREIEQAKAAKVDEAKAVTWMLPNKKIVRSFDGGHTYVGDDGRSYRMSPGAFKFSGQYTGADIALLQQKQSAGTEQPAELQEQPTSATDAAQEGTGVWANLAAAFDSFVGGVGIDKLFGKDGFFNDTQDARQQLRLIKQLGKSAFMNSSRGAIWEQKKIDKMFPNPDTFFTNPRTEARKFDTIRQALLIEKRFNNKALDASTDPKEIRRINSSNDDIDRLLSHIGIEKSMTFSDVMAELRKADAAGDTEKAAALAAKANQLRKLQK